MAPMIPSRAAVREGDKAVVRVDDSRPAAIPAEMSPTIPPSAVVTVGDNTAAVPSIWPPFPAMMAAEIEAGRAAVPVGSPIQLNGHDLSRFLYPPGLPQS